MKRLASWWRRKAPPASPPGAADTDDEQLWVSRAHLRRMEELAQRYRSIVDLIPEAVCVVAPDGRYLERNAHAETLTGIGIDAVRGRSFLDLVIPEDRERAFEAVNGAKQGKPQNTGFRVYNAEGGVVHTDLTVAPIVSEGEVVAVFGLARDMTHRVEAERRLKASEQKFRSLFHHSLDGILLISSDYRIIDANPAVCAMLQRDKEQLVGQPSELGMVNDAALRAARQAQRRHGSFRGELYARRADGGVFPVEVSASRFAGADGEYYIATVMRDISERKRAEHALRASREDIRRLWGFAQSVREQEQKRLAREVHDELGQLLTAMKLDLDWLKRKLPEEETFVADKVADLEVLLSATLDAQRRLLAGLRPRVLDELGLGAACQWLLREFTASSNVPHQLCLSHGEFQLEDELATTVFRIVQEALTNVARHAQASRVRVSLIQGEGRFCVRVLDDGCGLASRPDSSQQRFGLLGIRERVNLLNGELRLESQPGCGTELHVDLPLEPARAPAQAGVPDQTTAKLAGVALQGGGIRAHSPWACPRA
ncbi:PAS domain-containing sensor histidine kinase [Alkalilimnicola sp. S0819]|uniref:PAS domain-containing sensor histidine kinase n=1 Tax=Alkalilimnicola sp. S0819 TaxID=2613922 RepID=UPI00126242E6|nr:PAS domain-containing sensor histidine kinase [Alkalilimnicola sp. S0819]KAB7624458.1 PAS domain S-box protein [Alkalilimnicola sp. S0819]MPQ16293.1 PAS domain S-box protein [Alkalilimnicola sp. S0819]